MRYDNLASEIEGKTFQALLVFRKKGGPDSLPLSEVVNTFSRTHPGVSDEDLLRPIFTSTLLRVRDGQIYLAENVNEMANVAFNRVPSRGGATSKSEGGCLGVVLLIAGTMGALVAVLA